MPTPSASRLSFPNLHLREIMSTTSPDLRLEFFDWVFTEVRGYLCICSAPKDNPRRGFKQHFFHWPSQRESIGDFLELQSGERNLWFCVNLLDRDTRKKEYAIVHNLVWADLDTCDPAVVEPKPSLVIQSSPDRFQALWKLDQSVPPMVAEEYAKRVAYTYTKNGADPSGWDLTQLLRVPFTKNRKYDDDPLVLILPNIAENPVPAVEFENLNPPQLQAQNDAIDETIPDMDKLEEPEKIIYKYKAYLDRSFHELYTIKPEESDDWSARMWKLLNLSFEAGMEQEEVFSIALTAGCNKYVRDRRPIRVLWHEVQKAQQVQKRIDTIAGSWEPLLMPELVTEDDGYEETFLDRYVEWATAATDAVPVFHELSGAILLSASLAGQLTLEVRWGTVIPNLWGLVLGESTLTRKTTAMQMATNMLHDIDPEAVMATSGSAEGLLTALAGRPGRVSMYYRDEVSGLFDEINRKDYLAGMPETLTQLYDVPKVYHRLLRKESITISKPVFIFWGGGIREKVYSLLSEEYILSGFLPRFLVVGGDADLARIRRTGPPDLSGNEARKSLVNELLDIKEHYMNYGTTRILGQIVNLADTMDPPTTNAILLPEAWQRYGDIEMKMVEVASESYYSLTALPTFERLTRSLLKLAVLLAATRQEPEANTITVEERDIVQSARFIQRWGKFSVDVIVNAGKTQSLRLMEKVRKLIVRSPGLQKSELLRATHLSSRELNDVITNLLERGEITRKTKGRAEQYWILGN